MSPAPRQYLLPVWRKIKLLKIRRNLIEMKNNFIFLTRHYKTSLWHAITSLESSS